MYKNFLFTFIYTPLYQAEASSNSTLVPVCPYLASGISGDKYFSFIIPGLLKSHDPEIIS